MRLILLKIEDRRQTGNTVFVISDFQHVDVFALIALGRSGNTQEGSLLDCTLSARIIIVDYIELPDGL